MTYLIKDAKIIDKNSPFHLKKMDLLIKRGRIEEIGNGIQDDNAKVVKGKNLCVSPGWMDIGTTLTDPGMEDLDDIQSLEKSAASGGFTALAVFPNTNPVLDNRAAIDSFNYRTADKLVNFYPIGAMTVKNEGREIAEMTDMVASGAVAFSDGAYSIQNAGVLKRALRYVTNMDAIIINNPNDRSLSESGIINESKESAYLGLKGIPDLAEEIALNRDILLCSYTESELLAHMISTIESVKLVKKAKASDICVTASVSFHNLVETDKSLSDFDPMHKVLPPLRSKSDSNALIKGLIEGTIDCIVSNHIPVDVEDKRKAFFYAEFGSLGLEQLFGVLNGRLEYKLPLEVLIDKLSYGPREVLHLDSNTIDIKEKAEITIFDPEVEWIFTKGDIKSKSQNAAFLNQELKGKVIGVIANGKSYFN